MRLRREKKTTMNIIKSTRKPPIHHNKTSSMDIDTSTNSKNIYLNKILQKNLGIQRVTIEQTIFK